jgi:hypothetical protein
MAARWAAESCGLDDPARWAGLRDDAPLALVSRYGASLARIGNPFFPPRLRSLRRDLFEVDDFATAYLT